MILEEQICETAVHSLIKPCDSTNSTAPGGESDMYWWEKAPRDPLEVHSARAVQMYKQVSFNQL